MRNVHTIKNSIGQNLDITEICLSDEPKGTALILPGAGYSIQAPLMHYATSLLVKEGYQVILADYAYNKESYNSMSDEEYRASVLKDGELIFEKTGQLRKDGSLLIVGKSIGTMMMAQESNLNRLSDVKAIWMTPLVHGELVRQALEHTKWPSLSIIGDHDFCYSPEAAEAIERNPLVNNEVIAGTDHALQFEDDLLGSIDVLKQVVESLVRFLQQS
ncbi:alpha/beta fold hydrolase [Jeotgalibacillus sp. R-1-5s-1]|uniref:alpha/beta fold hydrolase n=1 Tax=Jeotgalibacillus sp. R-1-5s-1 TaxID=2555897 RepID=UPI001069953B|nr:alpha/beta family hydrolase [Jeotgalibacillus sp. R-1-5s-1]TFE00097.1 hypothetical protein E2491_06565 [Jeotgalibacillus sp. R-1-5s-1]